MVFPLHMIMCLPVPYFAPRKEQDSSCTALANVDRNAARCNHHGNDDTKFEALQVGEKASTGQSKRPKKKATRNVASLASKLSSTTAGKQQTVALKRVSKASKRYHAIKATLDARNLKWSHGHAFDIILRMK